MHDPASQPYLKVSTKNRLCTWQIQRPGRGNALGTTIAAALSAELRRLLQSLASEATPEVRALLVTAAPLKKTGTDKTSSLWIAGGDLKELAALPTREAACAYAAELSRFIRALDQLPLPVIIAIEGAAIGGGAELAMAGDLRFATQDSTFDFKQLRVGLALGYGTTKRLCDLLGKSRAQDILLNAKTLTAAEATRIGLIHAVFPDRQALAQAVEESVANWSTMAPEALAAQKAMLTLATEMHPGGTASAELHLFTKIWRNPAHAAFLERFAAAKA